MAATRAFFAGLAPKLAGLSDPDPPFQTIRT